MHKLKLMTSIGLATFLIVIPEPVTTFLGAALLSWVILHFWGWPGQVNGACRCDYCRNGFSKHSHHSQIWGEVSALPSFAPANSDRIERMHRAQATLPFIRGRDLTHTKARTSYCSNGRW